MNSTSHNNSVVKKSVAWGLDDLLGVPVFAIQERIYKRQLGEWKGSIREGEGKESPDLKGGDLKKKIAAGRFIGNFESFTPR